MSTISLIILPKFVSFYRPNDVGTGGGRRGAGTQQSLNDHSTNTSRAAAVPGISNGTSFDSHDAPVTEGAVKDSSTSEPR